MAQTYPCDCPRSNGTTIVPPRPDRPDDGTCDYCGSLLADTFMARLEAGDVILTPTDKNYKVYVNNDGGTPFKQTYGSEYEEPREPGGSLGAKVPFHWVCREVSETKFYFQHLSEAQQQRFIELLNEKKLKLDYPGHFYRTPYFIQMVPKEPA